MIARSGSHGSLTPSPWRTVRQMSYPLMSGRTTSSRITSGRERPSSSIASAPVLGGEDAEVVVAQVLGQKLHDAGLVVDDEHGGSEPWGVAPWGRGRAGRGIADGRIGTCFTSTAPAAPELSTTVPDKTYNCKVCNSNCCRSVSRIARLRTDLGGVPGAWSVAATEGPAHAFAAAAFARTRCHGLRIVRVAGHRSRTHLWPPPSANGQGAQMVLADGDLPGYRCRAPGSDDARGQFPPPEQSQAALFRRLVRANWIASEHPPSRATGRQQPRPQRREPPPHGRGRAAAWHTRAAQGARIS